ncbi:MAG TPA: hypothetical protein VL970_06585, partial [Candidatus Acidoferrales bacterium]|nr:hypothetical protein [Candidatus Acidoferrales bacterium]
ALNWNITWMPDPNRSANFEAAVQSALRSWNSRPAVLSPAQHQFALRNFNTPVQFGKLFRVYERLAAKS